VRRRRSATASAEADAFRKPQLGRKVPTITINTTGRGGLSHTFTVKYEHTRDYYGETWTYTIESSESPPEFFEARFKTMADGRIRIAVIDRNFLSEFEAKGIPEELFEHVVAKSRRTLASSVSDGGPREMTADRDPDDAEFRSPDAEKMWRRLVAVGRGRYDAGEDRYIFLPRTPPSR
jgi:hypothetical protein